MTVFVHSVCNLTGRSLYDADSAIRPGKKLTDKAFDGTPVSSRATPKQRTDGREKTHKKIIKTNNYFYKQCFFSSIINRIYTVFTL